MYDRSEAAVRRIVARARDGGPIGAAYVELAMALMNACGPSPQRDRALKRLADSCDDALPLVKKAKQPRQQSSPNPSSPRQMGR